jgi:hypothetical protein
MSVQVVGLPGFNEYEEAEEALRTVFLNREDVLDLDMKVGDTMTFDIDGSKGEVRLLGVEMKMYGWGGCGNNIGTCALVHVNFEGEERHDMNLQLGPAPNLTILEPLAFAFRTGDEKKGTAVVAVGKRPDKDIDPIELLHGKGKM